MNDSEAQAYESMEQESAPVGTSPDNPAPSPDSGGDDSSSFLDGLMKVAQGEEPQQEEASDEKPEAADAEQGEESKPKEEEADPDLADLPKTASERTRADWKKVKEAKREIENQLIQARKELEELKKQPPSQQNSAEIEAAKKELEEYKQKFGDYESRMAMLDVTQTEEYQNNIAQPLQAVEALIGSYSTKFEIPLKAIAEAAMQENVLERNAKLAELTSGMNEFDKFEFKKALDDARNLTLRAAQVQAQAKESLKYVQEKQQKELAQKAEQEKAHRQEVAQQTWNDLAKTLPESLRTDSALLEKLSKDALASDIQSAPPKIQAYATQAAVLFPVMKDKLEATLKENAELKAAIAKRGGALPKAKSGSIPTPPSDDNESFDDGLSKLLGTR